MGNLDGNPVVQALGLEHENHYIKEVVTFLFTLAMVQSVGAGQQKNLVQHIGTVLIRCYGGAGLLLPLFLGQMPGSFFQNFDLNAYTVFTAMAFSFFLAQFIPAEVGGYLNKLQAFSVAVVRANAAGAGYEIGKAAFAGSLLAPCFTAYVAANGHQLIEKGVGAWNGNSLNAHDVLAVFGGVVYWAAQTYLQASALVARSCLVLFRLSADHIDYDEMFNNVLKSVKDVTGASSMKRSRK